MLTCCYSWSICKHSCTNSRPTTCTRTKRHPHNCMSIKTGSKTCKKRDQISKKIPVSWRAVLSSSFFAIRTKSLPFFTYLASSLSAFPLSTRHQLSVLQVLFLAVFHSFALCLICIADFLPPLSVFLPEIELFYIIFVCGERCASEGPTAHGRGRNCKTVLFRAILQIMKVGGKERQ